MNDKINHFLSETYKHTKRVRHFLDTFIIDIIKRGQKHDESKFEDPELSMFSEHTFIYKNIEFGTDDYKKLMDEVKVAINHHHSKNRHHPEYWPNGVDDMTLVDLIEMIADWRAAVEKNKNGNINKSLEINCAKYNISPQLKKIFENTIKEHLTEK